MGMRSHIADIPDRAPAERASTAAPQEARAMADALRLARRGIGTTHPNPRVGAVVLRGEGVIARGYHRRPGDAHAEVVAIEAAGDRARGSTLVVTLEPCAHHGRTPPCVDAIVAAGIRKVVVGMIDPNPLVRGRGVAGLRAEGVEVSVGLREPECLSLNEPYSKFMTTGLPFTLLKAMVTLDGRMASANGDSRGLGGADELRLAHRLRAEADAIVVGIGTVLRDDPELTVRLASGRTPLRVVLDSALRTPPDARLLATLGSAPVVIATVSQDRARAERIEARGAAVWRYPAEADGRVPLPALLRDLAARGCLAILVEGGPTVHTSFLGAGLADRVAIGVAPLILGGVAAPAWTGELGLGRIADAIAVEGLVVRRVGRDVWMEGRVSGRGVRGV
jgi:diaminohydroxyphosphoribosylaminopyrimidine deaminase / 5-amino-6-(5-phosphoribosylamino)uracil reductase